MFREDCTVLENKKVAPGHYVLRMASARISKNARPGQFVQVLCDDSTDPLLPRPFSFLTAAAKDFSIIYQVIGKGTKILSQVRKGDRLVVLGPLGNGFMENAGVRDKGKVVRNKTAAYLLVGGGVGIPPLYHLVEHLVEKKGKENIHVFLGARDKSLLLCEKDFRRLGVNLHLSTDDGSKGKKGVVTGILEEYLHYTMANTSSPRKRGSSPRVDSRFRGDDNLSDFVRIYTCGPTPMLKAVSAIANKHRLPCEVSVEVPMACGFGACLGCVVKVKDTNSFGHRFAIGCVEGPVFSGDKILW